MSSAGRAAESLVWHERLLAVTGADAPAVGESSEPSELKLRSLRRLCLLTLACEAWAALTVVPYSSHPGVYGLVAAGFTACAGFGWRGRFARPATLVACAGLIAVMASVFPENANHQFLAVLMLGLLWLARPGEPDDARAALQALRWIAVLGIVWAGLMKLWYGYWFGGEFLVYRIAIDPAFRAALGWLLPPGELAQLVALGSDAGAGPFRTSAPTLLVLSNLTWLGELALPSLLLWSRTRAWAVLGTLALFVFMQLVAREIFFGGLMVGLILAFARGDATGRALPWIAAVYLGWLLRYDAAAWMRP